MLYFLDTNTLSETLKNNPRIRQRVNSLDPSDYVAIPIVAWFEVIDGRVASLLTAADSKQLLIAQSRLDGDLTELGKFEMFGVSDEAALQFQNLLTHKKARKLRRPDLLIACIALAHKAILVTRNVKDFVNVPGLVVQNWFD